MKRFTILAAVLALLIGWSQTAMAQKGTVVFYNAGGSKLGKALTKAFNKHHPDVSVELISAGSRVSTTPASGSSSVPFSLPGQLPVGPMKAVSSGYPTSRKGGQRR